MLYDNKCKIRLPNTNLGLYVVQNYLIEIAVAPVNQRAPQRMASERMATHQERTWYGADPRPHEAAHLHYRDYNPPSSSGPVGSTRSARGVSTGDVAGGPRSPVGEPAFPFGKVLH